jgi:H+/Cl- antiporter ClcA
MARNDQPIGRDWKSDWFDKPEAWKQIKLEAVYLALVAIFFSILLFIIWWFPGMLGLGAEQQMNIVELRQFLLVSVAGTLGGTVFSIKWLYHSVWTDNKNERWKQDRLLWRLFTPHISGLFSFAFFAILKSGLLNVEIKSGSESNDFFFAFGFIVGYFSDRAVGKLREIADAWLGKTQSEGLP